MTEEQIALIKRAKDEISALARTQDEIFDNLLTALDIARNETNNAAVVDWLFDTVYNTGSSQEEFDRHIDAIQRAMVA